MRYLNPVLPADFSDPDVIRDGGDYYMVSSSFNFNPAIPLLHSKNLVEWELIGHVFDNLPGDEFKEVCRGCGVWAPSLRKHGDTFYCLFPIYGKGIWACSTKDIRGKWEGPWRIIDLAGAEDPCPIWTDDGKCYIVIAFAKSKAGFNSKLAVYEAAPDLKGVLSDDYTIVYDGCNDNPCIEGPKFYTHGDYIYIYSPAGGVKHGWQTALRSKNIYGPYESKIVLARHDSNINGPHQGALVDTEDGGWAFIHFRDMEAYGRITYLQPAEWIDGWCIPGHVDDRRLFGSPVEGGEYPVDIATGYKTDYSDDFKEGISPVWQTPAVCGDGWYKAKDGLIIYADESPLYERTRMLTQRFSAFDFLAETEVDVSALDGEAALAVYGAASYSLCVGGGKVQLKVCDKDGEKILYSEKYKKTTARLAVEVKRYWEERAMLKFKINGKSIPVGCSAVKGRWVGARVAIYANGKGEAKFSYFTLDDTIAQKHSVPLFAEKKD